MAEVEPSEAVDVSNGLPLAQYLCFEKSVDFGGMYSKATCSWNCCDKSCKKKSHLSSNREKHPTLPGSSS